MSDMQPPGQADVGMELYKGSLVSYMEFSTCRTCRKCITTHVVGLCMPFHLYVLLAFFSYRYFASFVQAMGEPVGCTGF
jgi:hypothetical protein